jgi:hypothetical protein
VTGEVGGREWLVASGRNQDPQATAACGAPEEEEKQVPHFVRDDRFFGGVG